MHRQQGHTATTTAGAQVTTTAGAQVTTTAGAQVTMTAGAHSHNHSRDYWIITAVLMDFPVVCLCRRVDWSTELLDSKTRPFHTFLRTEKLRCVLNCAAS